MAYKLINAAQARTGVAIIVDGVACIVKSNDISKTGKHGHAKCRIEAIGVIDGKKKVFVAGGHDRLDVPLIEKSRAQVLTVTPESANVMDLETFETMDMVIPEDIKADLKSEDQVEYWVVEGIKVIKRKI
ncbi:MAG: translation initiation factor IF-5A [Candidatus Pacearchaeota archaeon]|jgi:translation initiation factor 5A